MRGKGLLWRALIGRPGAAQGLMDMASVNSVTTDSSAASSSWGSGARVFNGWVNVLPDGTELTPIAAIARDRGRRVGLVTTTTVTHATPAGFAAVQGSRSNEDDIAVQYLGRVDVILGAGRQFFDASLRKDKNDLIARYTRAGFSYVSSRKELMSLQPVLSAGKTPAKVLGPFSTGMIPFKRAVFRSRMTRGSPLRSLCRRVRISASCSYMYPRRLQVTTGEALAANCRAGSIDKKPISAPEVLNEAHEYARPSSFSRGLRLDLGEYVLLLISGTASIDENGRSAHAGDFRAQCRRTFLNVTKLLESEGATWKDIVRTTCYLRDIDRDYAAFNEERTAFYKAQGLDRLPASTGIQAHLCRPELLVEIEAIAVFRRNGA